MGTARPSACAATVGLAGPHSGHRCVTPLERCHEKMENGAKIFWRASFPDETVQPDIAAADPERVEPTSPGRSPGSAGVFL